MRKVLALVLAIACVMSIAAVSVFAAVPADGTYSVPVLFVKEDKDEKSMSSPIMGPTATVTVSNGQITMTVTAPQDATVMTLPSKMVGLQTADANGNLVDAQKNGNNFTFTVTPEQWNSGFVAAKYKADIAGISADLMGSMSSRDVRIKISTDQLTQTASAPQTVDATTSASKGLSGLFSQLTSLFKK